MLGYGFLHCEIKKDIFFFTFFFFISITHKMLKVFKFSQKGFKTSFKLRYCLSKVPFCTNSNHNPTSRQQNLLDDNTQQNPLSQDDAISGIKNSFYETREVDEILYWSNLCDNAKDIFNETFWQSFDCGEISPKIAKYIIQTKGSPSVGCGEAKSFKQGM